MRRRLTSLIAPLVVGAVAVMLTPLSVRAANGTWTGAGDGIDAQPGPNGLWSTPDNWTGNTIADGANNTANFNTLDITDQFGVTASGPVNVNFDAPRTLGHLVFGDTNTATPGSWEITEPTTANLLTLADATKPTITVNALTPYDPGGLPPTVDDAIIRARLAGTNGFNKQGVGIASVTSAFDNVTFTNNLTGTVNVNQGTLRVLTGATFDFEATLTPVFLSFTMATGTTLDANANVRYITAANGTTINTRAGGIGVSGTDAHGATSGVAIAAGGTLTVNHFATGTTTMAAISGTGSTANINLNGTGVVEFFRSWSQTGNLAAVNINGLRPDTLASLVRLRPNGGWNGGSFASTNVTLNNVTFENNQSTGGNTMTFGAINGNATSSILSGINGVGSSTYQVGALNTNAVFAGNIGLNAAAATRSLVIVKQGTGIWELSGALTYTPQPDTSNINRRGGITRIEAGTLKLTGTASLPAGNPVATHGVVAAGDLYATVDIRAGATLDVSGASPTYNSSDLQQTIGRGTIVGNYNHDQGILAPGDSVTGGNTASLIATAGTLTFANTLDFAGSGQINFDISPSLVAGNDLLQVGGASLAGTPTIKVGFLGGATSGAYTLINSNTPLVGTTTGWTVLWEGRGASPTLTQTATQVKLNISAGAAGNLNWAGTVDGVWNAGVAGTSNWQNTTTNAADKFFQLDNVAFRDTYNGVTAPTTTTIVLNSTVSPASVLFNSSLNYDISGTGRITGGASLTKQGTGTATLTTANDYTGGTTIAAGVLNRDGGGSFGSGTITFTGGELHSRGWTSLNPIVVPAATTAKIRNLGTFNAAPLTPGDVGIANINLDGSITGSGTLEFLNDTVVTDATTLIVGPQVQALDIRGDNTGFTGTIKFSGTARYAARLTAPRAGGTNVAYDLGSAGVGNTLGVVIGTHAVIPLGSITGGVNTQIAGYSSSGGSGVTVFEIGGLNTSTTFAGNIIDGRTDTFPISTTSIVKVGTGTLTLTNPVNPNWPTQVNPLPGPVYTGATKILAGTLSTDTAYLADTSDVYIKTGAVFNLNTGLGTIDLIDSLFFNNVPQPIGTYGAPGSGATFTSSFFTGTGQLEVTSLGIAPIPGDFDGNGAVQAADLAVWRNAVAFSGGGDADYDGDSDGNDFLIWQRNLGLGAPAVATAGAVPEPATWALAALVLPALAAGMRRRNAA